MVLSNKVIPQQSYYTTACKLYRWYVVGTQLMIRQKHSFIIERDRATRGTKD